MHDDPRLLPPWRGSSLLSGKSSARPSPAVCAQIGCCPQNLLRDWPCRVTCGHGGPMTITGARGILAVIAEPALRDELDRVAAAVGVRVVHAGSALPVSRKAWSAALAVVLDESAAQGCAVTGLPRRAHVIVVAGTDPAPTTWAAAIDVGAQHVLKLPAQEHDLVRELADAGDSARDDGAGGAVVAVIGGRGGGGGAPVSGRAGGG